MIALDDVMEVRLEELGEHSWLRALASTVTGSYGSAQFRFVARVTEEEGLPVPAPTADDLVGATFPVMRSQSMDDTTEPNAWIDIAKERLLELEDVVEEAGWRREPGVGEHWWSVRYTRPHQA